jgi:hypothetical protein
MAFNVNTFKSNLSQGVARAAHYELDVGNNNVMFKAISVSAPGRSLASTPSGVFGPAQEIAHSAIYTPINATIILSPDHNEREFFSKWQDKALGTHRKGGTDFYVGYYRNYADNRVVKIKQYDETGSLKKTIRLVEAYPRSIGEISYSYMQSEYATFNVTLQYRYYNE